MYNFLFKIKSSNTLIVPNLPIFYIFWLKYKTLMENKLKLTFQVDIFLHR